MPKPKTYRLNQYHKKLLDDFLNYLKIHEGIDNKGTINNYISGIQPFLIEIQKSKIDIYKISKKQMDTLLFKLCDKYKDNSFELYKARFRRFLEFLNIDKEIIDYIPIHYKKINKETKGKEVVLSPDEINTFINTPTSLRDKAIIELFLTTGGRINEICHLLINDVTIEKQTIWINFKGEPGNPKKKPRKIPIVADDSIPSSIYPRNLINYYNSHPMKNNTNAPLFYSISGPNIGGPLSKMGVYFVIKKTHEKSGITKNISPHTIRHTSATYDGRILTESLMRTKYGWAKKSPMVHRYCKIDENHLNDELKRHAGLKKEYIDKESKCPRCQATNNINADHCSKCDYPLDRDILFKEEEKIKKQKEVIETQIFELDEEVKKIKKLLKRVIYDQYVYDTSLGPSINYEEDKIIIEYEKEALKRINEDVKKKYQQILKEDPGAKLLHSDGRLYIVHSDEYWKNNEKPPFNNPNLTKEENITLMNLLNKASKNQSI